MTYNLSRWIFLRLLGVAYAAAFLSLSSQILGLIGHNGILPVEQFLSDIASQLDGQRYWILPTLTWFNASDWFLQTLCWIGAGAAILVISGICTGPSLFLCWLIYLSMVNTGQDFLSFQWDILLLESGFLAIFFAPWQFFEPPWQIGRVKAASATPSIIIICLLRWLLFRLMFESGLVKLASSDPTWANLTALNYHYFTQPLPTPLAWYAQKLPEWFQKFSVAGVFFIELIVPFFIFMPRMLRLWAASALIFLQILIALTGNYAFFNLLTIALCVLLIDDQAILRLVRLPKTFVERISSTCQPRWPQVKHGTCVTVAVFIGVLSLNNVYNHTTLPHNHIMILEPLSRCYFLNSYGLFAIMTTSRPEIQIEGSNDGIHWFPYEFKYKPGNLHTAPCVVAPFQPRLDWQMWFAALSGWRGASPWFPNFITRLLQGSPNVLALLAKNPFPERPPRYIRAEAYNYTFSDFAEHNQSGNWWHSEYDSQFFPPASLRE